MHPQIFNIKSASIICESRLNVWTYITLKVLSNSHKNIKAYFLSVGLYKFNYSPKWTFAFSMTFFHLSLSSDDSVQLLIFSPFKLLKSLLYCLQFYIYILDVMKSACYRVFILSVMGDSISPLPTLSLLLRHRIHEFVLTYLTSIPPLLTSSYEIIINFEKFFSTDWLYCTYYVVFKFIYCMQWQNVTLYLGNKDWTCVQQLHTYRQSPRYRVTGHHSIWLHVL